MMLAPFCPNPSSLWRNVNKLIAKITKSAVGPGRKSGGDGGGEKPRARQMVPAESGRGETQFSHTQ